MDEACVKVAGRWRSIYRAIDQLGHVVDVFVAPQRDATAARRFFERALDHQDHALEVVTDKAATYPIALDEVLPAAWRRPDPYANITSRPTRPSQGEAGPMRRLKQDRSAKVVIAGPAFVQNLQRGHYELAVEEPVIRRVAVAFDELALAI